MSKFTVPIKKGQKEIHDESLYSDFALSYSEPKNENEVCDIVKECVAHGEKITVCGGLTGINGAAVPYKCHSLNTKNLCNISYDKENYTVKVGSGTTFKDLEQYLAKESKREREFPISPTEKTASIGGALSFGTTGLRSLVFGPVSSFVEEIEYCDAFGNLHKIRKGDDTFTAFIGKEGMVGIITQITLRTIKRKPFVWSIMFFFPNDELATNFADKSASEECVEIIEYIDKSCFDLCERYKSEMTILEGIPSMPEGQDCAILVEIYSDSEDQVVSIAESLMEVSSNFGGDPNLAWAMEGNDVEKLRNFRHAISECINMDIALIHAEDSRIRKISIDIVWKNKTRGWILNFYRKSLEKSGLKYCIFGHIGTFSPYVSFFISSIEDYERANNLANFFYSEALKHGANIFSELGVGKLNKSLYWFNSTSDELKKRLREKLKFDPDELFNPTNMFLE